MIETTLLTFAEGVLVTLQAAWLSFGVYTNIRYPTHNKAYVVSHVDHGACKRESGALRTDVCGLTT